MKNVGLYANLVRSIIQKTSWNKYELNNDEEQINMVFSVLLFVMEKSLKDDHCTLDDIGVFIDDINSEFYKKPLNFDQAKELGDYIINTVLSNDGKLMTFNGYDYEAGEYREESVRYVMNRVVYISGDVRRTSYSLTDDGYNLVLSTLEVESNLRITIQELIFKLHLEKQSYDRAAQDIKELFNQIRIHLKKIDNAMVSIRRNALNFSVAQYEEIVHENMDMISDTKIKFENYRDLVEQRRKELEDTHFNIKKLSAEDSQKLSDLKVISEYLSRTIDEHQKILLSHFDLKDLYTKELESLSVVSMVKRFSLRNEIYEPIMDNPRLLEKMGEVLSPLYCKDAESIYDPRIALLPQRTARKRKEEDSDIDTELDEEQWRRETERIKQEKLQKYETCFSYILGYALKRQEVQLKDLTSLPPEDHKKLMPTVDCFKEVMVELIKWLHIDVDKMKEERKNSIEESSEQIELSTVFLDVMEKLDPEGEVKHLIVFKQDDQKARFENIEDEDGKKKTVSCSNVKIICLRREEF